MTKTVKVTDVSAFRDASALLQRAELNKILEKNVTVSNDAILWGDIRFEPQTEGEESAERLDMPHTLKERFQSLYGKNLREDNNSWPIFVEGIMVAFYQKFSLLVYEPITSEQAGDEYVHRLMSAIQIIKQDPALQLRAVKTDGIVEKILIATVKIRLDLGGAPVPTVVPFYFQIKEGGKYVEQLPPERSRALHRQISMLAQKYAEKDALKSIVEYHEDYGALIAAASAELSKSIGDSVGFGENLILEGETLHRAAEYCAAQQTFRDGKDNEEIVALSKKARDGGLNEREMMKLIQMSDVTLSASGAQLRYVAVLDCFCPTYALYDATANGKKLYDVRFDLSWKADVLCGRCGDTLISESILNVDGREIEIDLASATPLSDEDKNSLDGIENVFHFHAREKSCEWKGGRCDELVCDRDLFQCAFCGEERTFCTNCPHPEVVYHVTENENEVLYHTPHLAFVNDTYILLPKDQTKQCTICNRVYSEEYLQDGDGVCAFCAPLIDNAGDKTVYRNLYKQHRLMLPYWRRLSKHNFCNEDESILLFRSGNSMFRMEKTGLRNGRTLSLQRIRFRPDGKRKIGGRK